MYAQLQKETISNKEREELELLNNMIEKHTAERIVLMGELAKLRHISLQQLAVQLNTKTLQ